jgi:mono/diheme cytochrome c family protein
MTRAWVETLAPWLALSISLAISQAAQAEDSHSPVGAQVYSKYCTLCHGASGKGDGRAAVIQQRKPADLTKSARTFEYKLDIVRRGGAALNRSPSMPAWSDVLSDEEIKEVVAYLQTLVEQDAVSALQPVSSATSASVKDR